MKYVIAIIIILLILSFLGSKRWGCSNLRTPEITDYKTETVYRNDYTSYPQHDSHLYYWIYDENVECFGDHQCFMTIKDELTLNRDDICEHCNEKWKWHYNK